MRHTCEIDLMSFLQKGYIFSSTCDQWKWLAPCPKRIEAILSYPTPKNQKHLRQLLGVCIYHLRFIKGYDDFAENGKKGKWTLELQRAFENLRVKFVDSIHLVHPNMSLPYTINTDVSGQAIGVVLIQPIGEGETLIKSTASRVLKPLNNFTFVFTFIVI